MEERVKELNRKKGENVDYKQFLSFQKCFHTPSPSGLFEDKGTASWERLSLFLFDMNRFTK